MPKTKITIVGQPIPQPRHRTVRRGNYVASYDPVSSEKQAIKQELGLKRYKVIKPPIYFELTAYMQIPKSFSEKKKKALIGKYHIKKPDGDNIYKFYSDVLEGICYENDSHISRHQVKKIYNENPRVEIDISHIKEEAI